MSKDMKAWHCAFDFTRWDGGHVLVFAETPGKARQQAMRSPWDFEGFTDIKVRRAPKYDGIYDRPFCVDANDQLPEGVTFYSDEEWE